MRQILFLLFISNLQLLVGQNKNFDSPDFLKGNWSFYSSDSIYAEVYFDGTCLQLYNFALGVYPGETLYDMRNDSLYISHYNKIDSMKFYGRIEIEDFNEIKLITSDSIQRFYRIDSSEYTLLKLLNDYLVLEPFRNNRDLHHSLWFVLEKYYNDWYNRRLIIAGLKTSKFTKQEAIDGVDDFIKNMEPITEDFYINLKEYINKNF